MRNEVENNIIKQLHTPNCIRYPPYERVIIIYYNTYSNDTYSI